MITWQNWSVLTWIFLLFDQLSRLFQRAFKHDSNFDECNDPNSCFFCLENKIFSKSYHWNFCNKISSFLSTVLVRFFTVSSNDATRSRIVSTISHECSIFEVSVELLEFVDENFGRSFNQPTIFDFRIKNEFELIM